MKHDNITDIATYMLCHATELGERILLFEALFPQPWFRSSRW